MSVIGLETHSFQKVTLQYMLNILFYQIIMSIFKNAKRKDIFNLLLLSALHLQPVFENLEYKKGDFKVVEEVSRKYLSIPMSPYITRGTTKVINAISSI